MPDHIVSPDDVKLAARQFVDTLSPVAERDWSILAAELEWSCRETLDHTINALASYATHLATRAPERRPRFRDFNYEQSIPELLAGIESGAAVLAEVCRAAPDDARGFHPSGMADWSGFIGMGCTEVLIHADDITRSFDVDFEADPDLARRVLDRIFPWAPKEGDDWQILRWAAGRTALPDQERLGPDWYWHSVPLSEWDGTVNKRVMPPGSR
jgi:uncharacterized protein (TIGR03083 family)